MPSFLGGGGGISSRQWLAHKWINKGWHIDMVLGLID
jgi:hypothetical protein